MIRDTSHLAWIRANMPDEASRALAGAVRNSPNLQGAHWDDILDMLLDTDSHIGMREDLYDDLGIEGSMLPSAIMLTLLYSGDLLGCDRDEIAAKVKEVLARPSVDPEALHADPQMMEFPYPDEPPTLTTGQPSTLGVWRDNCAALLGEDSSATKYFDDKIKSHVKGREEWVVADESQVMLIVFGLAKQDLEGAEDANG